MQHGGHVHSCSITVHDSGFVENARFVSNLNFKKKIQSLKTEVGFLFKVPVQK